MSNPKYNPNESGSTLYVATGIAAPDDDFFNAPYPDRLVTIDALTSKIIAQTPIPAPLGTSNEPHHAGIIQEGNGVAFGGLLSVAHELLFKQSHPDIFYFDITDRNSPKYVPEKALTFNHDNPQDPTYCSATDEFYALSGPHFPPGTYAVTMMGSGDATSPGKVAVFDKDDKLMGCYPETYPDVEFNPHGISYDPQSDMLMTSDYVVPISAVVGPPVWRLTLRVWENFSVNHSITQTITIDDPTINGLMSVVMIPNHPQQWGYVCGSGHMYLVKPHEGTATLIFILPVIFSGYVTINKTGTRLLAPLMADIAYINIEDPESPYLQDLISIKKYSNGDYQSRLPIGCHYNRFTPDNGFFYASNYFITTPIIKDMGDKKVWRAQVTQESIINDPSFEVDFMNLHPVEDPAKTVEARPHAIVITLPPQPLPYNPNPVLEVRSPQNIGNPKCKLVKEALYRSIEAWLNNTVSTIKLVVDIKREDRMMFNESFNSLMASCNDIGVCYDPLVGKEIAAQIIRAIFLFSSQAVQVFSDLLGTHDPSFDMALWNQRTQELALLLANIYYLDYEKTLKIVWKYRETIEKWVVGGNSENYNAVFWAGYNLAKYLVKGHLNLRKEIAHINDRVRYKGLLWYKYLFELEMLYLGNPQFEEISRETAEDVVQEYDRQAKRVLRLLNDLITYVQDDVKFAAAVKALSDLLSRLYDLDSVALYDAIMRIKEAHPAMGMDGEVYHVGICSQNFARLFIKVCN